MLRLARVRAMLKVVAHRTIWKTALDAKLAGLRLATGPALVLGSAPTAELPADYDASWSIVTANASQNQLLLWGMDVRPTLTVFRAKMFEEGPHQSRVWEVLQGLGTEQLILVNGRAEEIPAVAQRGYLPGRVDLLSRSERGAIIHEVTGLLWGFDTNSTTVSQGVFAALLALRLGATAVLSGISFSVSDHNYGSWSRRAHLDGDKRVLLAARDRGWPIYAAEQRFADESGLPRWLGRGGSTGRTQTAV